LREPKKLGALSRWNRERAPGRPDNFSGRSQRLLLEQAQDVLRAGVGDRQRLDAELLLHLQRREPCRFFFHVGVDQAADAAVESVSFEMKLSCSSMRLEIEPSEEAELIMAFIAPSTMASMPLSWLMVVLVATSSVSTEEVVAVGLAVVSTAHRPPPESSYWTSWSGTVVWSTASTQVSVATFT
jgi:hypothetical protein